MNKDILLEMNLKHENLVKGSIYKLPNMLNLLEKKFTNDTRGRQRVLEDIKQYLLIECMDKKNYKYLGVRDCFVKKEDMRGKNEASRRNNKEKIYSQLIIKEEEYCNIGIYSIVIEDNIYIGSTIVGFRKRFQSHYLGSDKSMEHTKDMLDNGATFNILHNMTGIEDEPLIRMVENEYINYFKESSKLSVINTNKAWSYTEKKPMIVETEGKSKYKQIKVLEENYDEIMELLIFNGYMW